MTEKFRTETIKTRPMTRFGEFNRDAIDIENRTVEVAFSSETRDVVRWFGREILDHSPESVDLSRMNNGAPLLMNHDPYDQVGVIESARIDKDRVGRAVVRFSKSSRGNEIFQDVQDGIRTKISCGYRVHEMVLEREAEDGPNDYRVTRWEPFENSFVSIPADDAVGVGRELETEAFVRAFGDREIETRIHKPIPEREEQVMSEKNTPAVPDVPEVNVEAVQQEARSAALRDVDAILAVGQKYGMISEARDAINKGTSLVDFREQVLDRVEERAKTQTPAPSDIPQQELRHYSLIRAVRAQLSGDWSKAGFEREVSVECMSRMGGKDPKGFYVPHELFGSRAQSVGTANKGGDLVATELKASSFIEMLRARSVSGQVGVTYLPGLVGDVDIPKQTAGGSFGWLAEDGSSADTDITVGKISLSPKTISGSVYMTRKSLMQTTPAIEDLVRSDIVIGMALGIDLGVFEGDGTSNAPLGVCNYSGINTQTIAANATTGYPTYAELVGFETAIDSDNALVGSLAFVTTPAIYGGLRITDVGTDTGMFLIDKVGYAIHRSTQLDAQRILFGNFSDVIVGLWGALDINVDTATAAAKGGIYLRAFQDADIEVRHPESFCKNSLPA